VLRWHVASGDAICDEGCGGDPGLQAIHILFLLPNYTSTVSAAHLKVSEPIHTGRLARIVAHP
jgi:hypothetical protein